MIANPKILFITSRADFGGGPEHVFRLVEKLKEEIDIKIACPNDFPYFDRYSNLIGKENVIEIPHRKFALKSFLALSRYVRENRITIIHSHGKGAGIFSRLLKLFSNAKVIHTFHGVHIEKYSTFSKLLYIYIENILSLLTDKFISVSNSEFEKTKQFNFINSEKVIVINNGVTIPKIQKKYDSDKSISFLAITRNDPQKNNDELVKIITKIHSLNIFDSVKLNLIGENLDPLIESVDNSEIKNLINYHGKQLDTSLYYQKSDFFINTSLAEGMSLSILEAMSYGLPIIASKVTGNIGLVKDGQNGYLFDLNNSENVIKKIINCKLNENIYSGISNNNVQLIKNNYSIEIMATKTLNLYSKILKSN